MKTKIKRKKLVDVDINVVEDICEHMLIVFEF